MSGTLFSSNKDSLGASYLDTPLAVYENGKIYLAEKGFGGAAAKRALVGEYENGKVYSVSRYGRRENLVALYDGGTIYGVSDNALGGIDRSLAVGSCSCGKVYSHTHGLVSGSDACGMYNGDEEGAAAAAAIVLFNLKSGVSAYKDISDFSSNTPDCGGGTSPAPNSGGGGFAVILGVGFLPVACMIVILMETYSQYMSIICFVAIPAISLIVALFKKFVKAKNYSFSGFVPGLVIGFAISFVYVLVVYSVMVHRHGANQLINTDFTIIIAFVFFMISNGLLSTTKSKSAKKSGRIIAIVIAIIIAVILFAEGYKAISFIKNNPEAIGEIEIGKNTEIPQGYELTEII